MRIARPSGSPVRATVLAPKGEQAKASRPDVQVCSESTRRPEASFSGVESTGHAFGVKRLCFVRELPVRPEVAWPLVATPEGMSRWSEAPVTLVQAGEGGRAASAGAVRRIRVSAWGVSGNVFERVEASRPPHQFNYRVVSGMGIRGHRGSITLEPTAKGSRLTWELSFGGAVPGWSKLFSLFMKPAMGRSLDRLEALVVP